MPAQLLFTDEQVHYDGSSESRYLAWQSRVAQASALAGLGELTFRWEPALQTLTFHRLRILRGDIVIDLLPKDGAFTILRREEHLESEALIDGSLTVLIQPEGLQVGDVLDVAFTLRTTDPILKGAPDLAVEGFDQQPLGHLRLKVDWPNGTPVRWRSVRGLPEAKITHGAGATEALIEMNDLIPSVKPRGAPPRYQQGPGFSLSSYADWQEAAHQVAPMFEEASKLVPDGPLRVEARRIAAESSDPAVRAGLALRLVEDKVRYLAEAVGENGWRPAPADTTWTRRWGDCKAKTVLLIALLRSLGIRAEPVLVSTGEGDDYDQRLPSLKLFDHVLVRAEIGGRDRWLDGTRIGDTDIADLETPNYGWGLALRERGGTLLRLQSEVPAKPTLERDLHIDATKGRDLPAAAHGEIIARGDGARTLVYTFANLTAEQKDQVLKSSWVQQWPGLEVGKVSAAPGPAPGEYKITVDGTVKLDWRSGYEPVGAYLGYRADVAREGSIDADAPWATNFPQSTLNRVTLMLPDGGRGYRIAGLNVDRTLFGAVYRRHAEISGGAFRLETSVRSTAREIPYAEAKIDAPIMTEMARTTLKLAAPDEIASAPGKGQPQPTAKPATPPEPTYASLMATEPTTRDDYLQRGNRLLDMGRNEEAAADFDRAVSLDPGSGRAFADRGLVRARQFLETAAKADFDHAESLDPSDAVIWHGRAVLAAQFGRWNEAIDANTHAIQLAPSDTFALGQRIAAYIALHDWPRALADADEAIRQQPTQGWPYSTKIAVLLRKRDYTAAAAVAMAAEAAKAPALEVAALRAAIAFSQQDFTSAVAAVERSRPAKPTVTFYVLRATFRDPEDLDGRTADANAALVIDPKSVSAMSILANVAMRRHDYAAVMALIEKQPEPTPLGKIEIALRKAGLKLKAGGSVEDAKSDYAAIRQSAGRQAVVLNDLCYEQATHDFELNQALADCDAALKLAPDVPSFLDSRAFVLLRMGRNREALAVYETTLARTSDLAASLFGKSLTEARLGLTVDADRDRRAAIELSPRIEKTFADYGVTR